MKFEGKKICLIVSNTEKENDMHVYLGNLQKDQTGQYRFVNPDKGWQINLTKEDVEDLQVVPEALKEVLLHADYYLNMNISDIQSSSQSRYESTGMKWHK